VEGTGVAAGPSIEISTWLQRGLARLLTKSRGAALFWEPFPLAFYDRSPMVDSIGARYFLAFVDISCDFFKTRVFSR
jgi:hypothetical protein